MATNANNNDRSTEALSEQLHRLEKRISKIESVLSIDEWSIEIEGEEIGSELKGEVKTKKTESRIVEYGLAWLGSTVLVFGIIFLMSYTESIGYLIVSKIVAYLATVSLLTFAYFSRKTFPYLANVFYIASYLLFYYITVRLHFFTEDPLISSKGIVFFGLLILIGIQVFKAVRKNSEFLGTLAMLLIVATAIISDSTYITLPVLIVTALSSIVLFYRKHWWNLLITTLFMVYLTHLLWLFNNPIVGNPMKIVEDSQNSLSFLIGYAVIYSLSIFISKEKVESNTALISASMWNVLLFSLLLLITIPKFYSDNYIITFSLIALFCLAYAVILKVKPTRDFAPAMYACFGFMAISVAVYGFAGLPDSFFLLALQSFLVVSMALWFRSKIIVVANSFLFFSILLVYLITSSSIDHINFVFAFTALATARILGWRKESLTLKTDGYRNIYLLVTFFMILHSLNQALPSHYVTLAWTATAIGFFMMSIFLHNMKYRYLSIFTFIVTAGHLFFIDLSQMEIGYRVIAFLFFSIISIAVSLYYTKRINKK
jgi:hypothetical protein